MKRWRCIARATIVFFGTWIAGSVSAAGLLMGAGVPISSDAAAILKWAFAIVMGLFAFAAAFNRLMVIPILDKMAAQHLESLKDGLKEIAKGFEGLMDRHIAAHDPHPDASDRMHTPLEDGIDEVRALMATLQLAVNAMAGRLDMLIHDHDRIQASEGSICTALNELRRRDPMDSPHPRRHGDPVDFDARSLDIRGKGSRG